MDNISFCEIAGLFMYFPVDEYLECFQFLAIMNRAVWNIYVKVFYGRKFSFLLGEYQEVRLRHYMLSIF